VVGRFDQAVRTEDVSKGEKSKLTTWEKRKKTIQMRKVKKGAPNPMPLFVHQ